MNLKLVAVALTVCSFGLTACGPDLKPETRAGTSATQEGPAASAAMTPSAAPAADAESKPDAAPEAAKKDEAPAVADASKPAEESKQAQ